jgi:hypothetical protein
MLEVTTSPLLLVQGDLIVAKIRAKNSLGWGEFSPVNTHGQTTKQKPDSPQQAPELVS